jgi:hypothetical protein
MRFIALTANNTQETFFSVYDHTRPTESALPVYGKNEHWQKPHSLRHL